MFLRWANFSLRMGIKRSSSSIVVTFFADLASSSVRTPCPGPTSMMLSFVERSAVFIILARTDLSCKKFWPNDFFALIFWDFISKVGIVNKDLQSSVFMVKYT